MKTTIIMLVVLGIVAGVCAVALIGAVRSQGLFSGGNMEVTVIQSLENLPKGTSLAKEHFNVVAVQKHELIPGERYMTNLGLAIGRTLSKEIKIDEFLTISHFEAIGSIQDVISKLQPGERAVSVSLASSQVTGGLLYPGCTVDVLASFQLRGSFRTDDSKGEAVSTTLLERIEVLAIQGQLQDMQDEEKGTSTRAARSTSAITVTLRLDTKQAEALQLAAANGGISVTMRNPLDDQAIDPNPTVLNRGKLTRRGMLIDSIVKGQGGEGTMSGGGTVFEEDRSTTEVTIIRGRTVTDEEIKTGE
jgi:Flp pilus assembly protein CpaB